METKVVPTKAQLRYDPFDWLDQMTTGDEAVGLCHFTPSSSYTTFLASCYGLFARNLFGMVETLSDGQRSEWIRYISAHQQEANGLFMDPLLQKDELPATGHNWEYATWEFTNFGLGALEILGERSRHPLFFVDEFLNTHPIVPWLESLNWRNPWLESNRVMYLCTFLFREWERTGDERYKSAIDGLFDWLDLNQDPRTGFWGTDQDRDMLNAMAGAYHFYFFYFYMGRKVNYVNQILDNTLALQEPDGLYDPRGGGGACLDLDAIDILVKFSYLTDYRAREIKGSLSRSFKAIVANQNEDGGFCECKRPSIATRSRRRALLEAVGLDRVFKPRVIEKPAEYKRQIKWEKMRYRVDESNLWASWFRPLALALISRRYPGEFIDDIEWHFGKGPFIGWHDEQRLKDLAKSFS